MTPSPSLPTPRLRGGHSQPEQCSSNNAAICPPRSGDPSARSPCNKTAVIQSHSLLGPLFFCSPSPTNREERTKRKEKRHLLPPFRMCEASLHCGYKTQHSPVFVFENGPDASWMSSRPSAILPFVTPFRKKEKRGQAPVTCQRPVSAEAVGTGMQELIPRGCSVFLTLPWRLLIPSLW